MVHRKGATRAMPGQPVLVPGDTGTGSWLLEGLEETGRFRHLVMEQVGYYPVLKQRNRSMVKHSRELESRGIRVHANTLTSCLKKPLMLTKMLMKSSSYLIQQD